MVSRIHGQDENPNRNETRVGNSLVSPPVAQPATKKNSC